MIDRGFIKWQPFNSVVTPSILFRDNEKKKIDAKPKLFPEEQEKISSQIMEAYYAQEKVKICFYEKGMIKNIETYITKICTNSNTLYFQNGKVITFNQIKKIIS